MNNLPLLPPTLQLGGPAGQGHSVDDDSIVIRGGRIVTAAGDFVADLPVVDGRIRAIGEDLAVGVDPALAAPVRGGGKAAPGRYTPRLAAGAPVPGDPVALHCAAARV